jgi:hypothetical protein
MTRPESLGCTSGPKKLVSLISNGTNLYRLYFSSHCNNRRDINVDYDETLPDKSYS